MSNESNIFKRMSGPIFEPKFSRGKPKSSAYVEKQTTQTSLSLNDLKNTNVSSTSSYRYADKDYLVSTQQIRTDYSRFENHTFFHSAVANVNEAFDRIINFYPFDKDKRTIEEFEDGLTGFEKYVFDSFPKNVGYLKFSGSNGSASPAESLTNGSYIEILDRSGAAIKDLTDRNDGKPVLDPLTSSFSFEFWVNPAAKTNNNQILLQKKNSLANNITLALSQSSSATNCEIHFAITSGSNFSVVSGSVQKGEFSHVTAMYDRTGDARLKLLINDNIHSSSQKVVFDRLFYDGNSLFIGKGDDVRINEVVFTSEESFSGSVDDLKFFHKISAVKEIKDRKFNSFYPASHNIDDSLKLFLKFNEPDGNYTGNDIVIDSSGYSLHGRISNYIQGYSKSSENNPVAQEETSKNPVLFPSFDAVNTLNTDLLTTASLYDDYNPNLITRLVPQHYFEQGTNFRDYSTELTKLGQSFTSFNSSLGQNQTSLPNSTQVLLKLLFTYAKFFDELKIYIDSITSYRSTLYNDHDTTPDALLVKKAKLTNTYLPNLFKHATVDQFFNGVGLENSESVSTLSLNNIQKEIWRRYITEAPRHNLKKGTLDSIKSIFRNAGIEPDNIFNFREYGGSTEKSLDMSKEIKKDTLNFLSFTGSLGKTTSAVDNQGYPTDAEIPRIKSSFLSGSRTQPGVPSIRGNFVSDVDPFNEVGISDNVNDGLFTSGSFTYEGFYKWENAYTSPESIIRMHTTGTLSPSNKEGIILNLVGTDEKLELHINDSISSSISNPFKLLLSGTNVFDNGIWYISFGKKDTHDLGVGTASTASYFLRAAKQINGDLIDINSTSSFYKNFPNGILKNKSEYNTSGSFLVVGSQSFQENSTYFLNNSSSPANSNITTFTGMLANPRFFSKALTENEWTSHAKNYKSHGVNNPLRNYNFSNNVSGSFERLIILTDTKQATTGSDASGDFKLFDFSQNNLHFTGSNFKSNTKVLRPVKVNFEVLSDKFDINYSRDKIRVRSFQDVDNLNNSYFTATAPVTEILMSEEGLDDTRFSIDMSVMKALNEHILLIFSDYSQIENIYGNPNTIFSDSYHDATVARQIFFNNLLEKINLQKYRDLFKWVDTTFTQAVFKNLPRHTTFLGINFVYESHVLERNRMRYLSDEIYMKALQRDTSRGNLFLSQFTGRISKF